MPRYIDADALLERMKRTPRYFDIKYDIEAMPTADVVPRAEVAILSVQNAASTTANQILRAKLEKAKSEVAREIFEEINSLVGEYEMGDIEYPDFRFRLGKLEKKHTEGNDVHR